MTGRGLLTFINAEEAMNAVIEVEQDYPTHQAAAREIAAKHFSSDVVLTDLLDFVGIG